MAFSSPYSLVDWDLISHDIIIIGFKIRGRNEADIIWQARSWDDAVASKDVIIMWASMMSFLNGHTVSFIPFSPVLCFLSFCTQFLPFFCPPPSNPGYKYFPETSSSNRSIQSSCLTIMNFVAEVEDGSVWIVGFTIQIECFNWMVIKLSACSTIVSHGCRLGH